MKALSIKQPWAWAIAVGHKTIETRTWATAYRGPILIVSSLRPDKEGFEVFKLFTELTGKSIEDQILYGHAIATAELVDCKKMATADADDALCEVYPGAYSWFLQNVKRIEPFPVKGQLKIYEVDTTNKIKEL